jgi:ribosomal protein S18 acetylase RimI-like enzyme
VKPSGVIELPRRLIPPAAELMARALFDDPQTVYFQPDASRRAATVTPIFRFLIDYTVRFGLAQATSDRLEGLACWLPPGRVEMSRWRLLRSGAHGLPRRLGPEVMGRIRRVRRYGQEIHRRVAPGPHWYLILIGVEPGQQGRGRGSRLLGPRLTYLDELGLPCFLETHQERNIELYRRFGFEVAETGVLPESDVRHFALLRPPRD